MPFILRTPSNRRAPLRARSLFAVLILASGAAHAQEASYTLDAALQAATDRSSAMGAAQASVRASSDAAVRAGQLPDPMLKAGIDNLPVNGAQRFTIGQDFMTMRRIGIEQEWVSGDKRRLLSAQANDRVDRERAGYLLQLVNTRQQTAVAWLNAVYAKRALALQQEPGASYGPRTGRDESVLPRSQGNGGRRRASPGDARADAGSTAQGTTDISNRTNRLVPLDCYVCSRRERRSTRAAIVCVVPAA